MKRPQFTFISSITIMLQFILGIWAIINIKSENIATHFDIQGKADGFMPINQAAFFMPIISLVLFILLYFVIPYVTPKKYSLARSPKAYGIVNLAVFIIMLISHSFIIFKAAGLDIKIEIIMPIMVGLLLIIIGNYMPKMRQNYIMGIRTMWTLSDERVWDKTHSFSGPLFIIGGIFVLISTLFFPLINMTIIILLGSIIPAIIAFAYSYIIARKLGNI